MSLDFANFNVPLAAGLNQKADERALQPPGLLVCKDAQFDEVGGLQTRKPYASIGASIFGGGSLADVRRIVANGSELLCFTKDTLYSWNAQLSKWVSKGTHLAVKVEEQDRFVTPGDQVDADRAELSGTIVYTWTDDGVYAAAIDKTTGSVLVGPTVIGSLSVGAKRSRVVALDTKILLFYQDDTLSKDLMVKAIDPADPATGFASAPTTALSSTNFGDYYDVCKIPGADSAVFATRRVTTTAYTIGKVTSALAVTTAAPARTCTGAIAVSCPPTGTHVQVIRANGTNVQGDYILLSDLSDVYTAQAVGTTPTTAALNIAAAHRSTQDSSQYRCYVFWSSSETTGGAGTDFYSKSNWVDTGNTLGTQATFVYRIGIRSRAFDHGGRIYVWGAFFGASESITASSLFGAPLKSQLQNTYFLYRDDATLIAKAAAGTAGAGRAGTAVDGAGWLPGCVSTATGVYSFCGTSCRVVSLGGERTGYAARQPRDITVTFDSDEARRTARIGRTLYITGGQIKQYDGTNLVELGWHIFPWYLYCFEQADGSMEDGTYAYKATWRWDNAQGEIDRSTTATHAIVTIASGPNGASMPGSEPLFVTSKTNVAVEWWRTLKDPTDDAPFYLVSSKDPSVTSNPNRYITNTTTAGSLAAFTDELVDSDAAIREQSPENGGVLENVSPPAGTILIASADRLFLAGVSADPSRIWYSKTRNEGEVAAFNDYLTISLPSAAGAITGLAFLNETLIAFTETAVYALPGDGYDNTGNGTNYGPARLLSSDVGATSHESIALFDKGLIFKSNKGWYLLNKGWAVEYIGGPVADYDTDTVAAVHVVESQHQVRCLTTSRMLVLDYLVGQWSEWTLTDGVHAAIWGGTYHYASSTLIKAEQSSYSTADYGMDIETSWIKLSDLQGFGRVRWLSVLGEYRSAHMLRVRVARDYLTTFYDDKRWTITPTTVGGPEQVRHGPSQQQCQAIKVRLTVEQASETSSGYPQVIATGTLASGTGAVTVSYPDTTIRTNDIAILFVEAPTKTLTLTIDGGFQLITSVDDQDNPNQGPAIAAYWYRVEDPDRLTSPVIADAGDHVSGQIMIVRGCSASGEPFEAETQILATGIGAASVPGLTTLGDNRMVVGAIAVVESGASAHYSGWTCADLTSITEQADSGHASGTGGSLTIVTGLDATAGSVASIDATRTSATYAALTFALIPASAVGEGMKLTGLALNLGIKSGINRRLPSGQKQ